MKNFALRLNIAGALRMCIISFPASASEGRIDLSGTWQVLLDQEKMDADQTTQKWLDESLASNLLNRAKLGSGGRTWRRFFTRIDVG